MNKHKLKIKSPEGIIHYGLIRKERVARERSEWVAILLNRSFAEESLERLKQRLAVEFAGDDIDITQKGERKNG